MSPDSIQRIIRLLTAFDAEGLGDGNVAAGTNVLAAMACSIANIHRRGACIAGADSISLQVGSNLIASGPLTSSLINERVVGVIADIQTNLLTHLNEWAISQQDIIEKNTTCAPVLEHFQIEADAASLGVLKDDIMFRDSYYEQLLSPFPNQVRRALLGNPLVYVTGATSAELRRNINHSKLDRPLVFSALHSLCQCEDLSTCCLPIIDGSMTIEPLHTPIHGHVILNDPSRVLDDVVRNGGTAGRWLMRLPWLVDGNANSEISLSSDTVNKPKLGDIDQRYRLAMRKAWRNRLDHRITTPVSHAIDLKDHQAQWVRFLVENESTFPGISSAARPLLATLVFGLYEMVNSMQAPADFRFQTADVLVLARFLAQRMCVAHLALIHTKEMEQKQRNYQRVLDKLNEGPMSARDVGRKFHRMTTIECRNILNELRTNGRVIELSNDRWQLASNPYAPGSVTLTLDN